MTIVIASAPSSIGSPDGAPRRACPRLRYAIGAGSAMAFGNTVQMWALTILFTPYVIAIKRLSALFTVLASGHVLKEETRSASWRSHVARRGGNA